MLSYGTVSCALDLESPGKRAGFILLPHSDDALAFSVVRVPVGVIVGGEGPTVLLTAGSHGDEYEGQVILHRLMQTVEPADVTGRIILLPALNYPAVVARARVSPLDGGNMNRVFPGHPGRGPTWAVAAFVDAELIPRAEAILDFHSGGTSADYVDCGFLCLGPDVALNRANLALADQFGAPFTMVSEIDGTGGDFDTAAHRQGTPFLSCELGGMGGFSQDSFLAGWQGALRILSHLGVMESAQTPAPQATCFIDVDSTIGFVTAAYHGLAQLHVGLGQKVSRGEALATLFDPHNFGEIREELVAPQDGYVAICRRNPMVQPGDHLCLVGSEIARDALA